MSLPDPDPTPVPPPQPPPAVPRSEALEAELAMLEAVLRPSAPDQAPEAKGDQTEPPPETDEKVP